jgi:hypothetical protein
VEIGKIWKDKFMILAAKQNPEFEVHILSFGIRKPYLIPLKTK